MRSNQVPEKLGITSARENGRSGVENGDKRVGREFRHNLGAENTMESPQQRIMNGVASRIFLVAHVAHGQAWRKRLSTEVPMPGRLGAWAQPRETEADAACVPHPIELCPSLLLLSSPSQKQWYPEVSLLLQTR